MEDNNRIKIELVMKLSNLVVDSRLTLHQNCPPNFGGVPEWPKGTDCKSVA